MAIISFLFSLFTFVLSSYDGTAAFTAPRTGEKYEKKTKRKDSLTQLVHARERKEDSYEAGNFHSRESFTENTEVQQTARTCTHIQHSTSDAGSVASYLNDKISLPFPPKKRYFLTFQAVLYFKPPFPSSRGDMRALGCRIPSPSLSFP